MQLDFIMNSLDLFVVSVFGPMYIFAPKNSGWHSTNASQRTVSSRTTFIEVVLKKKGENTLNRLLATYVHFIVLLSL